MRRLGVALGFALCAVLGAMLSCKQGEGERCQVESDCEANLNCNAATGLCESMIGGPDGNISPDANVDGGPPVIDAAPDAMVDAMIDAP